MKKIVIIGSSGFIGSNLVKKLMNEGHYVVGYDIERPKYVMPNEFFQENWSLDWRNMQSSVEYDASEFDEAYCLACLMGGMGFIGDELKYGYDIAISSTEIITNFINYCRHFNIQKVFYSSSACVYNQDLQTSANVVALKESDAIPASPDLLYGWQKLYAEKMFEASGLNVRIARFHNIFGEYGTYDGGKEKAPAALCRKVAMAKDGSEIEVWGSGIQSRSFLHISECLEGVQRLMDSGFKKPINIGSEESISINNLADMIIKISGKKLTIKNVDGNVGVMGRNSDNTLISEVLNWRPTEKLETGIAKLYSWIEKQVNNGNV